MVGGGDVEGVRVDDFVFVSKGLGGGGVRVDDLVFVGKSLRVVWGWRRVGVWGVD